MTATATTLRRVGGLAIAAGSVFVAVGTGAWFTVTKQLRDERITIPGDAPALSGKPVQGPSSAYVEAAVIKRNAEKGAGGHTFAEISDAIREVDPKSDEAQKLRNQSSALSTGAALRTSLLTSVLAYGVSALVAGLGLLFLVSGAQLRKARD